MNVARWAGILFAGLMMAGCGLGGGGASSASSSSSANTTFGFGANGNAGSSGSKATVTGGTVTGGTMTNGTVTGGTVTGGTVVGGTPTGNASGNNASGNSATGVASSNGAVTNGGSIGNNGNIGNTGNNGNNIGNNGNTGTTGNNFGNNGNNGNNGNTGTTGQAVTLGGTTGQGNTQGGNTTGGNTTGGTGSGFCQIPTFPAPTNDGVGVQCASGGTACASGLTCDANFGFCTATCNPSATTQTCPGQALCLETTSTTVGSCFGLCRPSQNDCSSGMACTPFTPGEDIGYCFTSCTGFLCQYPDAGTNFTCTSTGFCGCTTDNDCNQNGQTGLKCDVPTGTCYTPCATTNDCTNNGCCAQTSSADYCDEVGPAMGTSTTTGGPGTTSGTLTTTTGTSGTTGQSNTGTTGTTGTTSAYQEGPHAAWPQVPNNGGPILAKPQIVSITFKGWSMQTQMDSWATWVASSSWLATVGKDYGVSNGPAPKLVHLTTAAPTAITDAQIQTFIGNQIESGTLPASTSDTVYMIYYPSTTTITYDGEASCQYFGGYHGSFTGSSGTIYYAVIADCQGIQGLVSELQNTQIAASHELIEASTDPNSTTPAWYLNNQSNPWAFSFGEVGDMCVYGTMYEDSSGNVAQRIWSNSAAKANTGSPCVPIPNNTPFFAASGPNTLLSGAPGSTVQVKIEGWSDRAVNNWTAFVWPLGGTITNPTITPGWPTELGGSGNGVQLNNDQSQTFSVTIPSTAVSGQDYMVLNAWATTGMEYNPAGVDTMWWPIMIYAN